MEARIIIDDARGIEWWVYRHMSVLFCSQCRVNIGDQWQSKRHPNRWHPGLCRCGTHRQGDNPPLWIGWGRRGKGSLDDPSPP